MTVLELLVYDEGTAGKVGFIRVPAVPLSFPEKRLFAVTYRSGACVASGGYSNVPQETLGYFFQFPCRAYDSHRRYMFCLPR